MANATKYVDNVNGNNGNTGDSEAQAYADIPTAIAAITGGGNIIYVQAGANYTLTSTIAITAALKGDVTDGRNRIEGYTTTPGARDGRPTITSATNSVALFTLNDNDYWEFTHLHLTHTAATRGNAFSNVTSASTPVWITDCIIDGCSRAWSGTLSSSLTMTDSLVTNCTDASAAILGAASFYASGTEIRDNTGDGFRNTTLSGTLSFNSCLITGNGGAGINENLGASVMIIIVRGCTICENGGSGLIVAANTQTVTLELVNNVMGGNGGYNVENLDAQSNIEANLRINRNNFYYTSTSGSLFGISSGNGDVSLTGDPFTNSAAGDFSLNNTAGAGADVRAAGFPAVFPGGTTTSYPDGGAAQHQDTGGSGGLIGNSGLTGGMQ